ASVEHARKLGQCVEPQRMALGVDALSRGVDDDERRREPAAERVEAALLGDERAVVAYALDRFRESGERVLAVEQIEKERAAAAEDARDLAQDGKIFLVGFEIAERGEEAGDAVERAAAHGQRAHVGARRLEAEQRRQVA